MSAPGRAGSDGRAARKSSEAQALSRSRIVIRVISGLPTRRARLRERLAGLSLPCLGSTARSGCTA